MPSAFLTSLVLFDQLDELDANGCGEPVVLHITKSDKDCDEQLAHVAPIQREIDIVAKILRAKSKCRTSHSHQARPIAHWQAKRRELGAYCSP